MSQLYALMADGSVKHISLKQEVVPEVRQKFLDAAATLKPEGIEEDEFEGDIITRKGENITFVRMLLPEGFNRIPDNQADIAVFQVNHDIPKGLFWYENGTFYFQIFNKKNILAHKMILLWSVDGNAFSKLKESGLIIDDKVQAIFSEGKLYFQSYYSANQLFPLVDFVTEATNEEIDDFCGMPEINVDGNRIKNISNIKTRRLIKILSQNDNTLTFLSKTPTTRKRLLKALHISIDFSPEGAIILPEDNAASLNRVLAFLNDDIFQGPITKKLYQSNSKKKDQ